jgi:hypothetical protein
MKKVLMSVFLLASFICAGISSFAQQRFADLHAGFSALNDTVVIANGSFEPLIPVIFNLGPDTVQVTDTLFIFGNVIGAPESAPQAYSPILMPPSSFATAIHLPGNDYLVNNITSGTDSTFEICFGVYTRNIFDPLSNPPVIDTITGNNKKCVQVTYKGKPLGIAGQEDKLSENLLKLSPNPALNQVDILVTAVAGHMTARIIDYYGRTVGAYESGKVHAGTQKIHFDISGLSPGIYFVEVRNAANRMIRKLVKQ